MSPEPTEYLPRPVRYRFGELLLAEWWPRLAIWNADPLDVGHAASLRDQLPRTLPPKADGVLLRDVPAEHYPVGIRRSEGYLEYVPRHDVLYLVDVDKPFSQYLAQNFSGKSRQNIQRAVRKLLALAGDTPLWTVHTDETQMAEFLREAAALSARTYQARLLRVGLANDEDTLRDMCTEARQGRARGYLLRLDGQTLAFAWCREVGRRLIYETIGYSTAHASLSPGNVLLYHILADVFSLGRHSCVDFGPGEAPYKSLFSTRKTAFVDAYFFRPGPLIWLRVVCHFHLYRASVAASHALGRWGVKDRLKAGLRRLRGVR